MNKSTHIFFLITALLAATFVSYTVYQRIEAKPASAAIAANQATTRIAVALRDLKRGEKITAEDLRMAPFLNDSLPKGNFNDLSRAVDRIVLKGIAATEPILESSLAPTDITKGGMAAIIESKKRAMAVKVDDVVGVAGFLQPGHLVDVLVTFRKPGEQRNYMTKTVLENIPVLSIGTQSQESDDKKAKKVTVVTLEVNPEEGEKLALAITQGKIQLALRKYADDHTVLTKGTSVHTLLDSYAYSSGPMKTASAKAAPVRSRLVVEVMNGNNVNRMSMDSYR